MAATRGRTALSTRRIVSRRQRAAHDRREAGDEGGLGVRHLDPGDAHPELGGLLLRLDVEVPADLEVIRDEADGTDEDVLDPQAAERGEMVEDVGPEPGLAGRRGALVGERPVAEARALGDEARRLVQLALVRVAVVE